MVLKMLEQFVNILFEILGSLHWYWREVQKETVL
jgi:hypothetical protein